MTCTERKKVYDRALAGPTHLSGEAPPLNERCPFCGTFTEAGTCNYADCPSRRPAEDIRPVAGPDGVVQWARSPEPAPVRIVRGAWPLPADVWDLLTVLQEAGGEPFIVGGAARDAVLGRPPKDYDFEMHGLTVEQIKAAVAPIAVGEVRVHGERFGVVGVWLASGIYCEIALPREDAKTGKGHAGFAVRRHRRMPLRQAAERREYTFCALYWDPIRGEIYDFFDGIADVAERHELRAIGDHFVEDPARPIRGLRFAGQFRLRATPDTLALFRKTRPEFLELEPAQRQGIERKEWLAWAEKSVQPSLGLEALRQGGWCEAYPALQGLLTVPPHLAHLDQPPTVDGVPQGIPQDPEYHPEGGAWVHTLCACDRAAEIADRDGLEGEDRQVLLSTMLLHDCGKGSTTEIDAAGRIVSPKHAVAGAAQARAFLEQVGVPQRVTDRVCGLIRWHMDYVNFNGSTKHVRRRARDLMACGESLEMLARVVEADQSARPPLPAGLPEQMREMLAQARRIDVAQGVSKPILNGRHLQEAFSMGESPFMGQVLRAAEAAQREGAFHSVEGGLRWVAEHFRRPQEGPWPRRGRFGGRSPERLLRPARRQAAGE